nr:unnamed protein product [Digitaria exilis]
MVPGSQPCLYHGEGYSPSPIYARLGLWANRVNDIVADNTDAAAEEIIGFLERTRQESVIYLNGWYSGLGASAVLKAVVERYRSSCSGADSTRKAVAGLDKIIHIDCSLWQSKKSLQKAIAEELKLPPEVMAFFDQVDEEDDFDGVQHTARGVIPQVRLAILNELSNSNCKFLVVFHNGSGRYVDLWEYGVPVMGAMSKRVLWTSRGRFLFSGTQEDRVKESLIYELAGLSDVAIRLAEQSGFRDRDYTVDIFSRVFHAEAEEVARYSGVPESKIVSECILYKFLTRIKAKDKHIDWATHATNYLVCDGIIHDTDGCGRSAWEIGNALHRDMNFDWPQDTADFIYGVLTGQWEKHSATGQDAELVQDRRHGGDGECFQKLWVLELSYTYWFWLLSEKALDLMAELRELHVKGPGNWSLSHLHISTSGAGSRNGRKLLKLRVVGGPKDSDNVSDIAGHKNQPASTFPNLSSWHILKTVILDGCVQLEEIRCTTLPPSLESFSFTSNVPTKIKSISFRGCTILKSLLLNGFFGELVELDMSATSVKTLDLSEMQALRLKRLFLLGCQKLRTILWPHKTWLEVLRIDTIQATWAMEDMCRKQESASKYLQLLEQKRFPRLRRIHLYELPKLQRICGQRMLAPRLETVKIRGCWSLKRLPAVPLPPAAGHLPNVDCEKELWDSLEWDGEEADHHPSHYKTTHSAYYKKTLLRASVLR